MDMVRLLLNNGADPNVVSDNSSIDGDQTTVLTRAVEQNYEPVVKLLLENGADPNITINGNQTALSIAEELHYELNY